MGPAFYVIAILGCGEGETACRPVQVAEARYESREACVAATEAALGAAGALDFPVVVAECRAQGAQQAALSGADVRLPGPDRRPSAWNR